MFMHGANRWRRGRWRRWGAWLALAGLACETTTEPALPGGATLLTPPVVFAHWWAMTESCSGLQGNLAAVTWYVVTGSESVSNGVESGLAGYYSPKSNRIVLADTGGLDGAAIRHEMLHALLGPSVTGHPRDEFLGRCAGIVRCVEMCITDAGPPPPADPAAVTVSPSALRVAGVVDPPAPNTGVDDGWFTFTILVTNPLTTPIEVSLAPSGDGGPPVSFSWDAECLRALRSCGNLFENLRDERADDAASVTRFAPGETKRFVVDFRIADRQDIYWALPAGAYALTGYYNGRLTGPASTPDTALVGP